MPYHLVIIHMCWILHIHYILQICKDGYATPCANYTYVLGCNDTYCPDTCTLCEPGYACRGGQRYVCLPGTYSKGTDGKLVQLLLWYFFVKSIIVLVVKYRFSW